MDRIRLGRLLGPLVVATLFAAAGVAWWLERAEPAQTSVRPPAARAQPVAEATAAAPAADRDAPPAAPTPAPPPRPDAMGLIDSRQAGRAAIRPPLTARSYIAIDADTGQVLLRRGDRQRRPIASLTKMMTGLLVAETGDLKRQAAPVLRAATEVEPNRDDLKVGARYARWKLLYSLMLASNNDVADVLAVDEAGSLDAFFVRMNERARALNLRDTVYACAHGLDDDDNLSTARDQAVLLREAIKNPTFRKVVGTRSITVSWPAPTVAKEYLNHNKMLWSYDGTFAGKTGFTTRAGATLAVAVERDGRTVIAVVLASDDIWGDMPRLVDRAFAELA